MAIGELAIGGRFLLAPLSGLSDSPMRLICRRMGASMAYSEMISAEGLVRGSRETFALARFSDEERPVALQLFGARPETMAEAARRLSALSPDAIDLNAGCPSKKVVRSSSGAALLRDLDLLGDIAAAVVESVGCPVAAKIRSGWDETSVNAPAAAAVLEENGVSAIAIHPRTRAQRFAGRADWSLIREVKASVGLPVFGSGDVLTPHDALRMLEETACDAVLIGRAAVGNPWIFKRANELLELGTACEPAGRADRIRMCVVHLDLMVEAKGERRGVLEMRKHLVAYLRGFPGASRLRYELVRTEGREAVRRKLLTALGEAPGSAEKAGERRER